jgi:hypothetical protein
MAKYEFKFVLTDVELSEDDEARVSRAIAQAAAAAVADLAPAESTVIFRRPILWQGIPPSEFSEAVQNLFERTE